MANFETDFDADKIFPKALLDEGLATEMIKAGQDILLPAIQRNANKHIGKTRALSGSLKKTKVSVTSAGDVLGGVNFTGKDKNGMANAQKAIWIEYGTENFDAMPMVRPAVVASESAIKAAMNRVFERKVK
ncbi:MAG: hypothetical protein Pg6B_04690 [Candidatus Azobacteroides pseudotrichonymphae]|uniref:Phage protein HK97 gp10 family n=1 Tax=Candidatus Improbicoccus pseudotrichonymphae TaxID=3033792 RepID=A0AA48HUN0_9FIRM|nr:MAG: phage protein HK97 gp10 family [Candidatus Improbicoccus pseudotrichonymphae]BED92030.1 MAG: phage protein HK97 gp10 family [Candidatus Improbicoccus pseudotrichonymphae]GMO34315.1 MAG: hypothetical protein Pg6B_04690 [Candidatus Azobacteroides pseudotrichonymphae]